MVSLYGLEDLGFGVQGAGKVRPIMMGMQPTSIRVFHVASF